jgi:hypothetical protein
MVFTQAMGCGRRTRAEPGVRTRRARSSAATPRRERRPTTRSRRCWCGLACIRRAPNSAIACRTTVLERGIGFDRLYLSHQSAGTTCSSGIAGMRSTCRALLTPPTCSVRLDAACGWIPQFRAAARATALSKSSPRLADAPSSRAWVLPRSLQSAAHPPARGRARPAAERVAAGEPDGHPGVTAGPTRLDQARRAPPPRGLRPPR